MSMRLPFRCSLPNPAVVGRSEAAFLVAALRPLSTVVLACQ